MSKKLDVLPPKGLTNNANKLIGVVDFVLEAIVALRDLDKSKGINPKISGLNACIRQKFQANPVEVTRSMKEAGLVDIIPRRDKNGKGYVMLYLKGEAPQSGNADDVFARVANGRTASVPSTPSVTPTGAAPLASLNGLDVNALALAIAKLIKG